MNFLPLWTAMVCPTNSGRMVERRDQVLSTFFWRDRFISSTRSTSFSSTYGPFLSERPIAGSLFLPSRHDGRIRRPRATPRLVPLGRLAPRRHRMVAFALALAAAHGVVDGVHDRPAHGRAEAHPAHTTGLADRDVFVIEVADLADRGHALDGHVANLARRQLERGAIALLGQELRLRPRAAAELPAAPRLQLHVVHEGADGDIAQRERVAGQDVGLRARHDRVADLQAVGGDDVALLAVAVV